MCDEALGTRMFHSIAEVSTPGGNSASLQRSMIEIVSQGHSPKRVAPHKLGVADSSSIRVSSCCTSGFKLSASSELGFSGAIPSL